MRLFQLKSELYSLFQTVARILDHLTLSDSTVLHSSEAKHNKFNSHNLESLNLRTTFPSNYKLTNTK